MLNLHLRRLALLGIAVLSTGCVATMAKMQQLDDTLRAYEGAMRWNEFELASGFGGAEQPGRDFATLNDIKVTAYQVTGTHVSEDGLNAKQTVLIQYYRLGSMREHTIVHEQHWTYDETRKRWILRPGLPGF